MEKRYINRIILGVILAVLFIFICVIAGKHAERSMIKFFHNFEESAVSYAREYNNDVIAGKVNLYELEAVYIFFITYYEIQTLSSLRHGLCHGSCRL